jgi:hypothetical protein
LFHNEGGHFREVSHEAGPFFEQLIVGRGVAFGDLDNDGDVDIIVSANNGPAIVLLNQTNAPGGATTPGHHWIEIALRSQDGRQPVTGARVGIVREGQSTLWRRARTDGSYLSASDARVHVGLGNEPRIDRVLVEWPDGAKELFPAVQADRIVMLQRGHGRPEAGGR